MPNRPVPVPDELTAPFWRAARERRLELQRCTECGSYNHPPRPFCGRCLSEKLQFEPVSGRGAVYSFVVTHQPNVDGFEDAVPYVSLLVELDEQRGLFMVSDLPGAMAGRVSLGDRVELVFEKLTEEITLPVFIPVASV